MDLAYKQPSGGSSLYALKQVGDVVFHRIEGLTVDPVNLVLLQNGSILGASMGSSDTLAMYSLGAVSSKLTEVQILASEPTYHKIYSINMQSKTVFKDSYGRLLPVEYIGVSKNEKYAIAQVLGRGPARIDLVTREVKLLANISNVDHDEVLAIANDGRSAVVAGSYTQKIYTGLDVCGTGDSLASIPPSNRCRAIDISGQIGAYLDSPLLYSPSFNDDSTISVLALNRSENAIYQITITPGSTYHLKYLALGDSYSSGEGDIGIKPHGGSYYLKGTESNETGCHLSSRSYPYLLRDKWNISSDKMRSVACSGARVLPDYYGSGRYDGQQNELSGRNAIDRAAAATRALNSFAPGLVRQIDFVAAYQPEILTFTGGGNDIGFADIIEYCASSYRLFGAVPVNETCAYADNRQMRANLNHYIDDQYSNIKRFIETIKQVSPETKIYMMGYPQFVSPGGWSCLQQSAILNDVERKMISESISRFNNILKLAAQNADIYYVDIENSLSGGKICEGSKYMTGPLRLGVGKITRGDTREAYHPNAEGHKKIAEAIDKEYRSGMKYDTVEVTSETGTTHRLVRALVMPGQVSVGSSALITMNSGMFKPNGEVTIEMFSQPTKLGVATADQAGGLKASYTIPRTIGIGVHLLTLTGYDSDNEPLQVQQFIHVVSDVKGDIDGDGIPDDRDDCYMVTEWYADGRNICAGDSDYGAKAAGNSRPSLESPGAPTQLATILSKTSESRGIESDQIPNDADVRDNPVAARGDVKFNATVMWQILIVLGIITSGIYMYGKIKKREK